ncbi:PorP/SprF family type IX secretion system membrane protein [Aurantibacillus circumpalustris]|uniref:PorP/SprF family type IX secretion system membrane protein n=1 Tax=Aurantibacillus circumpalustris TaxID=3036359 RepID=UPI00295B967E|nr:type IX secretion system membrane protein PorP/SprF [Aurantibacillus circumpalustris]
MKTYKNKKSKLVLVSALLFGLSAFGQQDPMYTHYMYNTLMVNPAYAGSRDAITITGLHRSQWVSFKGAPIVQSLTIHSPLKNDHLALGLSILNDKIGPSNRTSFYGDFAYRIDLTKKSKLALGLSAGVNMFQANLSSLGLDVPNDPSFQNNINRRITPNFGFGAYYSRERFYAGVSIPNLIENKYSSDGALSGSERRHYFFIAGAVFNLSDNLAFKPTTFVKVTSAVPIQADFTASFIIMKKLTLGAMYRTSDAFGGLIGFNFTQQLFLGYSYDWSFGLNTGKYNQGSHEIVLRFDFLTAAKKQIHSPRYF